MEDGIALNTLLQYLALALIAIIGWLLRRLWAKIDALPNDYVPRNELQERDKRLDVIIAHTNGSLDNINKKLEKGDEKLDRNLQRIFDKIEESEK